MCPALVGEAVKQLAKGATAVEVEAVPRGVLTDDQQFLDALRDEGFRFGHKIVDGQRLMRAADERYGAVGAGTVAALGNLEVGVMARCRETPSQ